MYSIPEYYRAELDYRRETLRRDWRSLRGRRTERRAAVRNQISQDN